MNEQLVVHEQVIAGPRFWVGTPVKYDGHFGLVEADDPKKPNARIASVQLVADVDIDWVSTGPGEDDGYERDSVTYPRGWEYLLVRLHQPSREIGWVTESDLVENGYRVDPEDDEDDEEPDEGDPIADLPAPLLAAIIDADAVDIGGEFRPSVGVTRTDLRGAAS